MGDIYQELWDLDQAGEGVRPVLPSSPPPDTGYVVVHETLGAGTGHHLFPRHEIPHHKREPYALFERVAGSFNPMQGDRHRVNQLAAIKALVASVMESPPMEHARTHLERMGSPSFLAQRSSLSWEQFLFEYWFSPVEKPPSLADHTAGAALRALGGSKLLNLIRSRGGTLPDVEQSAGTFLAQLPAGSDDTATFVKKLIEDGFVLAVSKHRQSSAFEHIFLGERGYSTRVGHALHLGGQHFWYKYLLDQGPAGGLGDTGGQSYLGLQYEQDLLVKGTRTPECTTLRYRVELVDRERNLRFPATKGTGSFFNGCSPAGLMALAMVRFYDGPLEAVINQARYGLGSDRQNYGQGFQRTFFPVFRGLEN